MAIYKDDGDVNSSNNPHILEVNLIQKLGNQTLVREYVIDVKSTSGILFSRKYFVCHDEGNFHSYRAINETRGHTRCIP